MIIRIVNEYLPKINFLLLLFLVVAIGILGFDYFKSKKESQEVIKQVIEITKKEADNKVVIVSKDGVFQILEGKEVSIESLSPLIVKYQDNVFKKDGAFYLYTKDNVIYVFDMYNKSIIGSKRRGE